jgi:class 3 adenylate cyclase
MGSRVRFNYTMMGDSVNLAARCESGIKESDLSASFFLKNTQSL